MYSSILLLLPALAFASPVAKRQGPSADLIKILDVSTSGTGCPQGSVSTSLSTDGQVVTIGFDSFLALIGPTAAQADKSKNCQIHSNLQYPGGFQYSVVEAVYHGYARLDPGVTGTFLSTYFFSQNPTQSTTTRSTITGPEWAAGNVYTKEDQVESTVVIWSPCGDTGILNVNNRISLSANSTAGTGELSDDDATVSFNQQLHFSWQPCTAGGSTGGGSFETGGGSVNVEPREPEPQLWGIGDGSTVVTPAHPSGGSWVIPGSDGGSTVVTPGDDGGSTVVTPGKE